MFIKYDISAMLKKMSTYFKFNEKLVENSIANIDWEKFQDTTKGLSKNFSIIFDGIYSKVKFNSPVLETIDFSKKEICVIHFNCDNTIHYLSFIFQLYNDNGTIIVNYHPSGNLMDNGIVISDRILTYPISEFPLDCDSGLRYNLVNTFEFLATKFKHNPTNLKKFILDFKKDNNGRNHTFSKFNNQRSISINGVFNPDIKFSYSLDDNTRLSENDCDIWTIILFDNYHEILCISHLQKNITGQYVYVFETKFDKDFKIIQYRQQKFNSSDMENKELYTRPLSSMMSYEEEVKMFKFIANKENQSMKEVLPELTITGVYDFTSDNFKERMSIAEILTF